MKKFEEVIFGKVETMATQPGCSMTRKVWYKADDIHELSKDWISPEDHQAEIAKRKQQYEDHQEIYSKTAKKLNEAELELSKLKSQLEKQQPEIPEFVATEIEEKNRRFSNFHKTADITHYVKDVRNWYYEKPYHAELFYRAVLDGYTVKEKRFYLKNKFTGNYLSSVPESNNFYHIMIRDPNVNDLVRSFTQQEIDSMETGSYEQIEVEK